VSLSSGSSHSTFDVGRSTCPQCLDSGVSSIQQCDLYTAAITNQMHYAWQAGVRCSSFHCSMFDLPAMPYNRFGTNSTICFQIHDYSWPMHYVRQAGVHIF